METHDSASGSAMAETLHTGMGPISNIEDGGGWVLGPPAVARWYPRSAVTPAGTADGPTMSSSPVGEFGPSGAHGATCVLFYSYNVCSIKYSPCDRHVFSCRRVLGCGPTT